MWLDETKHNLDFFRVRIVIVGDVGVGKSCLIKKFCDSEKFVTTHAPTIGVDYGSKSASVTRSDGNSLDTMIDFFDLSGIVCISTSTLLAACLDLIILSIRLCVPQAILTISMCGSNSTKITSMGFSSSST